MLVRCLYASRAAEPLAPNALDQILERSRRNNPARGITGLLCLSNNIFVQVLEGSRTEVSALMAAIIADKRHHSIEILTFEEIPERHFGNWTMGKVNLDSVNGAALLKYSEKAELDPFGCSARTTLALLIELASTGAIANRG